MKLKTIFMLLLIFPVAIFSQKKSNKESVNALYECVWSVKYIDDTIKMISGLEDQFILHIGDDLSYQFGRNSQQHDSLWNTLLSWDDFGNYMEERRAYMRNSNDLREDRTLRQNAFGNIKLYKNHKTKKIKVMDHIGAFEWFIYEESFVPQIWEIQDDTTTIAGYACQKAVCDYRGRSYEAWFTSEIPISEGPWKFNGLPGLIVRLNDTKYHYEFELVEFKKSDKNIDVRILSTNKYVMSSKTTHKLKKIERRKLLKMQWGIQGELIKEAEMAKVGFSHKQSFKKHDYIERDYK